WLIRLRSVAAGRQSALHCASSVPCFSSSCTSFSNICSGTKFAGHVTYASHQTPISGRYGATSKMITKMLKNLHKEESGQDLIEYALVALIIALGALAGMGQLASSLNNEFNKISGSLT